MIFAGIDPGVTGALAFIRSGGGAEVHDLPVMVIEGKKRRTVLDCRAAYALLLHLVVKVAYPEPVFFLLEAGSVGAAMKRKGKAGEPPVDVDDGQTGQSIVTLANSFRLNGQLEGMLVALAAQFGIRYEIINPQTWKRAMMPGEARDKDAARQKAIQLFPSLADGLKLKKHHNRAEALLLALWGKRRDGGGA